MFNISDGIIESRLGQVAGFFWVIEALVVEDGEVQSQSQSDRVGGLKLAVSNIRGSRVGLESSLGNLFVQVVDGVLRNVSVVISLHLEVENLGLRSGGLLDQLLIQQIKDILAVSGEFIFELLLVVLDQGQVSRSLGLFFLLNRRDSSPSSSSSSNGVLVGNRQKVSLFNR